MILSLPDRLPVQVAKWERDGVFILSGGADCLVHLWRPRNERGEEDADTPLRSFVGHGQEVLDLSIAPDLRTFVSVGGDRQAFVWDVGRGCLVRRLSGHQARINSVIHLPQPGLVATGGYDRSVRLWDARSSTPLLQSLEEATDSVSCVAGSEFILGTASVDGGVRRYDLRNLSLTLDWICRRQQPCTALELGPASLTYLVATLDDTIRAIDGRSDVEPTILREYRGHVNRKYRLGMGWTQEGGVVYSGSEDGTLHLWPSTPRDNDKGHRRVHLGHTGCISSVQWRGSECLTGSHDGTIRITRIQSFF